MRTSHRDLSIIQPCFEYVELHSFLGWGFSFIWKDKFLHKLGLIETVAHLYVDTYTDALDIKHRNIFYTLVPIHRNINNIYVYVYICQ